MTQLNTFEESVKARLKEIVADLIPEDRWEELVRATVADFERVDLPKLVKEELAKRYRDAISTELSKPEWQSKFTQNANETGSDRIRQMLVEVAPDVLAGLLGGVMQQAVYNFRNSLNSYR